MGGVENRGRRPGFSTPPKGPGESNMVKPGEFYAIIGIRHGFSCINIRQIPWEVLKTEAGGSGFQHLPRDLANVIALKNYV